MYICIYVMVEYISGGTYEIVEGVWFVDASCSVQCFMRRRHEEIFPSPKCYEAVWNWE